MKKFRAMPSSSITVGIFWKIQKYRSFSGWETITYAYSENEAEEVLSHLKSEIIK